MPEKLFERLKHQNYFMTTNLKIVKFLLEKGVVPYNNKKDKYNPNIIIFYFGNSSKLRACLYEYFGTRK